MGKILKLELEERPLLTLRFAITTDLAYFSNFFCTLFARHTRPLDLGLALTWRYRSVISLMMELFLGVAEDGRM